jgi:type I restriction enzyme R subunit
MSYEYSEDNLVETATQDVLEDLGWDVAYAWTKETFGEHGLLGREHKGEVILRRYLLQALRQLNPGVPETAYLQAIDTLTTAMADRTLVKNNQDKYHQIKNGVEVSYNNNKGETETKKLRVIDFEEPTSNHFMAVRQLEIVGELYNRRPDVICFVNGLPLVFMELKAHHTDLRNAYTDNITDYKDTIPHVFHTNAFIILSNGTDAKVGTITSPYKFFLDWKRITEDEEGVVSLDTMLRGTCSPANLLDIFENFLLFDDSGGEIVKIMAKNHQYIGVNKVLNQVNHIDELKGKLGVFWHTQGSGKSYSMVFICQKILRKLGGAYTFLIVVDRSELERQIYDTFTAVGAVPISKNKDNVAKSRDDLRKLLQDNQRYVFTLIHKFSVNPAEESEYPRISDRNNIIVISDEAHRTQAGTFARNMRFNAIPNASYLGFTGTPIIKEEEEVTKNIFGEYVSVYDFKRSIEDGATLPLRYLNRGEKLKIQNPKLNEEMAAVLEREDLDDDQRRKLSFKFNTDYVVLTSEKRLDAIAKDLVWHFNERGYQGKAMLVTLDKPTAVMMYDQIMKHWATYTADLEKRIDKLTDLEEVQLMKRKLQKVKETEVCVVVSSEQNEVDKFRRMKLDIAPHRKKMVERDLETQFKDEEHPFRLAIVCAMWITGFDAPCVSTVYLDKPITGHTLMQTIARANRVYDDEKENGLIVDYGNVHTQLEKAYSVYGEGDKGGAKGQDAGAKHKPTELLIELAGELEKCINECIAYLKELGYNLDELTDTELKPMQKLGQIKKAVDCICLNETTRAKYEVLARDMFRKYKALYPEEQVKPFIKRFNAIEAIYQQLNQQTKDADIIEVMMELQRIVNENVVLEEGLVKEPEEEVYVDLAHLDFDKLKAAFARTSKKNTIVFDLQRAVDQKLKRMLQENPMRMEFYERYQKIIEEYNKGKSLEDTMRSFDKLNDFIQDLNVEDARAMRENLTDESLAIFDLLRSGKELTPEELKDVKKIAAGTLNDLKVQKLNIDRWRESRQIQAQVKTIIFNAFQWLPERAYTNDDVAAKTMSVYQHIYTNYPGGTQPTAYA